MTRWQPDASGRLIGAAIELFAEQGYEATTVAEIAERAGLSKRTFFRYFADKREVLFGQSEDFEALWVTAVAGAPAEAGALEAACAAAEPVGELFAERFAFARMRAQVIAETPELLERELIKLQRLAGAIEGALVARGVEGGAATLAAQATVTIFQVAWARWVEGADPHALSALMGDALGELRAVTAA